MLDWQIYLQDFTDVYQDTLINTVGWRDRDEELHSTYLFDSHAALNNFLIAIDSNEELK